VAPTAADIAEACAAEPPAATEIGVTPTEIRITVMADTGAALAPGFAQANVDAVVAFADHINALGGLGCRQLVVDTWDSKLDPTEVKNGQIAACGSSFALVGDYSVFNPDPTAMEGCVDQAGVATGLPNIAAFAVDTNEACSPMTVGVNARAEACPVVPNTERPFVRMKGPFTKLLELHPGLHGVYVANADLPSTIVSAIPDIGVQEQAGIVFDAKVRQFSREQQSDYTARVAYLQRGSNYVYNGSSDFSTALYMKEAVAQGVDMSQVTWACGVPCYSKRFLEQGAEAVENAYMWIQFLPFEEADTNAALQAYVDAVGADKADTYGAVSWQAAIAFQQAVNQLVLDQGPNSLTRANLLEALRAIDDFSADGMAGARALGEPSPCYVLLQVQGGEFVRVWPEERGTMDCDPENLGHVTVNPEQASDTDLT
jgi:ABC-type branched-subunit amino acid transport system substrate-binding protein